MRFQNVNFWKKKKMGILVLRPSFLWSLYYRREGLGLSFPFPSCTFCFTSAYQQPESWGILKLYPELVVDSRLCQFLQPHHCVVGVACLENTFCVLRQRSWIRGIPEACSPLEAWKSSPLLFPVLAVWL